MDNDIICPLCGQRGCLVINLSHKHLIRRKKYSYQCMYCYYTSEEKYSKRAAKKAWKKGK